MRATVYSCYAWCTHAYVISKDHAKKLSSVNECRENMSVDALMNKRCHSEESRCGMYEYPTMSGCYGGGLLQQNRTDMVGMHDEHNAMRE